MSQIAKLIRAWLAASAFAGAAVHAQTTDFWGSRLPDQPTQFIFGYGSLINSPSREATAGKPVAAIPVRVSAAFGYVRSWSDRAGSGFTTLGLRRPFDGEAPMTINGVIYPVAGNDMSAFDAREKGYVRVEVPRALIEAVSWQPLPAAGTVWVYVPKADGNAPGEGLPVPDANHPLVQSYIDVVIEGGLEYGPQFAREIIATTRDWSPYWLNDRTLARRPWVFDKQFATVDALLAASAPCFAKRAFSEDYAAANIASAKRNRSGKPEPSRACEDAAVPASSQLR
ncbi:gamma-glutamylcyclotransferase [Paraburkholderia sp. MMS20-SJTR3]|uniref:Gamma-glutamylcyclotransferase n=1 Tax=Paraburkholderia sejongensis TaxID=2886946 RepID=A0ABS8JQH7_9BURK|nr:gamma-glutamylcyclotransferase family protein [Paraburkholderia sp. MMS20-SJTR3]MCC8392170.1 gamma-glutamylcyclotransferase [Paraburkholderia sp. MMS20-SJTR3]